MTHPTLTLPSGLSPTVGSSVSSTARVRESGFGDGYSQISGDGINSVVDEVTVVIEAAPEADVATVVAQLKAWKGATTFFYRLPAESSARRWTCRAWSASWPDYGHQTLSFTLKESFAP